MAGKRRAPVEDDSGPESSPDAAQTQRRQRQRASPDSDAYGDDADASNGAGGELHVLVKKLVRLVLAHEFSRQPLRRNDINAKVLGTQTRRFKEVFGEAQRQLRLVFGMEMTELPVKDKITTAEKRAAQKVEKVTTNTNTWILTSTLPNEYRQATIMQPNHTLSTEAEAAYRGLYTFVVALILINGGELAEAKLERQLMRTNASDTTPVGPKEKVLARMAKEGYVVKHKDSTSGEEIITYSIGPRGRVEVGADAVRELVKTVYGDAGPHDLDKRLERSLGWTEVSQTQAQTQRTNQPANEPKRRGRPPKQPRAEQEASDDE
ncbi:MAGE-domain-containing protein [Aulographum hederae CBS 113979]|uniref:MAGE-domain-containing protein n=1 Tax=Aulographum hederae CBS 113979 TaxID=1176131 RepID=A0A6G1GWU8_9PEZI|nr:MAGE-domain-containing protein [Aulographum hederae CBS 113979]